MEKYRKEEYCFFNHSLTKWQNISPEVEICKSGAAGICLKDGDELLLRGFGPSLCWNHCMDNSSLPALKNEGSMKNQ